MTKAEAISGFTMLLTQGLPEGVDNVHVRPDNMLVIKMSNGFTVVIDPKGQAFDAPILICQPTQWEDGATPAMGILWDEVPPYK